MRTKGTLLHMTTEQNPVDSKLNSLLETLNTKQREAYEAIISGENVFLCGPGGTGKSYTLTDCAIYALRNKYRKKVMVVAPTGIAALHCEGATIHRQFNFPASVCLTKDGKPLVRASKALQAMDVLVIDEISMVRIDLFESIIWSLRKIQEKTGKKVQLIVCGDFGQIPPVVKEEDLPKLRERYPDITNGFCFKSELWEEQSFHFVELDEVVRQKDEELVRYLTNVRNNNLDSFTCGYFNTKSAKQRQDAMTIYPYNAQVDARNREMLNRLSGNEVALPVILSADTTLEDVTNFGAQEELVLKVGCKVMLTTNDRNSLTKNRPHAFTDKTMFVNGSEAIVTGFSLNPNNPAEDTIEVKIMENGAFLDLKRQSYNIERWDSMNGSLSRKRVGSFMQFPLRLAYACTIHKVQGLTLEKVNISAGCFEHGMLYTALSRCTNIENVFLENEIIAYRETGYDSEVEEFYKRLRQQ